jgi:DNA-binding NarL/FixJ family response regulator
MGGTVGDASDVSAAFPPGRRVFRQDSGGMARWPQSSGSGSWPFVGRERELGQIEQALATEGCPGVVLYGSAGVGKSRLAREALTRAGQRGGAIEWVQATRAAASIPLGAFAALLPDAVDSRDHAQMLRGVAAELAGRTSGRLLLGIDDAHLLDEVSAALTLHLAVAGSAFVVATVRDDQPPDDAIVTLWKDAGAVRIDLAAIDEQQAGTVLEHALNGPVALGLRRWAFRRSQGNLLFLHELVTDGLATGAIDYRDGAWQVQRSTGPGPALSEMVLQRLRGLDAPEREAIELLSIGQPLPLDVVEQLVDDRVLAALEAGGLITIGTLGEGAPVRLAHPLYGEVVDANMTRLGGRALRRRLAAVVSSRAPRPRQELRVATWLLDAGEPVAPDVLLKAAEQALAAPAPDLAARLAQRALDDGAGLPAALLLARALVARNRFAEAEELLAPYETELPEDRAVAYAELRAASVLFWGLQRPADALALIERLEGRATQRATRDGLLPLRLLTTGPVRGWPEAAQRGTDALADDTLDPAARARIARGFVTTLLYVGRVEEAIALTEGQRPPIPLRGELDDQALVLWGLVRIEGGHRWRELASVLTDLERQAADADDELAQSSTALLLGGLATLRGLRDDGIRWTREAISRLEHRDATAMLPIALSLHARALCLAGDVAGARATVQRTAQALRGAPLAYQEPFLVRAEAIVLALEGEASRGVGLLLDAAARLPTGPLYAGHLLYDAFRQGARPADVVEDLRAAAAAAPATITRATLAHVEAALADDAEQLLAAAAQLREMGAALWASDAAGQAAAVLRRAGRQDSARRAAALAAKDRAECAVERIPALTVQELDAPDLTTREREVAALAARDYPNAEIADALVLSVRTVETHLYRAMSKLGVTRRSELAQLL